MKKYKIWTKNKRKFWIEKSNIIKLLIKLKLNLILIKAYHIITFELR
jgi:hypothetical protein